MGKGYGQAFVGLSRAAAGSGQSRQAVQSLTTSLDWIQRNPHLAGLGSV